jgi:hypothetical protein
MASSIRESDIIPSISTGAYKNVTNQRSRYNINYRHQQSTSTIGTNTNDRDAISDAIMPSEYPHAPNSPLHPMQHLVNTGADTAATGTYQRRHNYSNTSSANDEIQDDRIDDEMLSHLPPPTSPMQDLGGTNASGAECQQRTCICHDKVYPKDCSTCQPNNSWACQQHVIITCSALNCQKQFHKSCICHLLRIDLSDEAEINSYMCMECTCTQQELQTQMSHDLSKNLGRSTQMFCLGLVPDQGHSNSAQDEEKKVQILLRDMATCMPPERLSQFKNTHPLPYPSAVKMNDKLRSQ